MLDSHEYYVWMPDLKEPTALLKSGLVLAGANWKPRVLRTLLAAPPPSDAVGDDEQLPPAYGLWLPPASCGNGEVTAEDVTWMDLRGTKLVVLSACETGLGLRQKGDAMYGLLRSFFIAGAHAVICSLWEVPDAATATLMRHFYAALLEDVDCDEALRRAKLKVKEAYPKSPGSWAGFVLYGNAGALGLRGIG